MGDKMIFRKAVAVLMPLSLLAAQGIEIDRHAIELEKPLKKSGTYEVAAKLHTQVTATVKVVLVVKGEVEAPAEEAAAEA